MRNEFKKANIRQLAQDAAQNHEFDDATDKDFFEAWVLADGIEVASEASGIGEGYLFDYAELYNVTYLEMLLEEQQ